MHYLTVLYEAAKKRLINLYSAKSLIPEDTWPPTVSKVFINLALIKFSKDSWTLSITPYMEMQTT